MYIFSAKIPTCSPGAFIRQLLTTFMIQFSMSKTFKRQGVNVNDDDNDRSTSIIMPYLGTKPSVTFQTF